MTITFRTSMGATAYGNRTATTIAAPAEAVPGDLIVAFLLAGAAPTPPPFDAPAGWSLAGEVTYGNGFYGVRVATYVKPFDGAAGWTWGHVAANAEGQTLAYVGVDLAAPLDVPAVTTSAFGTVATIPSLATVTPGALSLVSRGSWGGGPSPTPAGWTFRRDAVLLNIIERAWPAATTTSPDSYPSGNVSADPYGIVHVVLRPYVEPPPPPAPVEADPRWWTHRLAGALGLDGSATQPVVELRRWSAGSWQLDAALSSSLMGYRISHGRKDPAGRTPPTSCVLQLVTARAGTIPIGTRLQLALSPAVCAALGLDVALGVRWTGEVTDPSGDHDAGVTNLTCAGRLGRTSRQPVDLGAYGPAAVPELLPVIVAAARTGAQLGAVDAGGVPLQPPDGSTTAGALFDALVNSTGGQLVEQPTGALDWHGPDHRRGMQPRLTLAAAAVLRRVTWAQSVGQLVNVATVGWAGGQVTVEDTASSDPVAGFGPYTASVDTLLTSEADAYDLGTLIVGRRAQPAWQLPDLTVVPDRMLTAGRLTVAQLAVLLSLRHGERVQLDGLPAGCPVPARVIVEGWEESATARDWQLALSVSDPALSGVSLRWTDVDPALTWAQVHPDIRWLDVARMETSDELLAPPD